MSSFWDFRYWFSHSASYPMTTVYTAGVLLAVVCSEGRVPLGIGLLVFTLISVLAFLIAVKREVRAVRLELLTQAAIHEGQQQRLEQRVEELIAALQAGGMAVPR